MPASRRPGPTRRQFLRRAALLAAGAPVLVGALDGCTESRRAAPEPAVPIFGPDKPVTWDIPTDNAPMPAGLAPEKDAVLRVFTYDGYLAPEAISTFEKEHGVTVEVSAFNNTAEALNAILAGSVDYDVYTPGYDQLGRLVTGGFLRPISHGYVPNIGNLWPVFRSPWYDRECRYSVPFSVYTTGIGWRTDQVGADVAALVNPYAALWDPAYKDKTAVVDDWHTAMAMVLLKLGITDVNTSSADDLARVEDALRQLRSATAPAVSLEMYRDLPAGLVGLSQMWSGDIIYAAQFLPADVKPDVLRYWFPADGKGLVENDLLVGLRGGRNPVAAQLFINHLLDPRIAAMNFAANGYQQPQTSLGPDSPTVRRLIPQSLRSAIVRPEYFDTGYRITGLETANEAAWLSIWRGFKTHRN